MRNDPFLQFLSLSKKAGKLIVGYNKCEAKLKEATISLIIISVDCSMNTKKKFNRLCEKSSVEIIECYTKDLLGKVVGMEEISILGVEDENMSLKLFNLFKEQKNI